ncbi:MAG: nitrilase-related carbon-nitrogen hydrolase, partial [Acidobacteriota bacterium]
MKIALIQQHATHDPEENLQRGIAAYRQAAAQGAQLIAYAELALRRFFPQSRRNGAALPDAEPIPGPTSQAFSRLARQHGVVTVLNLYEADGDRRFDSSPVIDADGSLLGVTRMLHIMDGPCFHETDYYHPGDRGAPVYDTAAGRIGVAICYDRHYPEYMRALGVKGAQLVVVPQAGA